MTFPQFFKNISHSIVVVTNLMTEIFFIWNQFQDSEQVFCFRIQGHNLIVQSLTLFTVFDLLLTDLGTGEPLHSGHLGELQLAVHEDCHTLVQLTPVEHMTENQSLETG